MKKAFFTCSFYLAFMSSSFAENGYARMAESAVDRQAIPSLEALLKSMQNLAPATAKFCKSQTEEHRSIVNSSFHSVMDAWQVAQIFSLGPLVRKGRFSRVYFWPGRAGSIERYLRKIFMSRPPDLTDSSKIGDRSVAVHSLAAFERFMFDPATGTVVRNLDSYKCRIALAIAVFQAKMIGEILDEWRGINGFRRIILEPERSNPLYRNYRDVANDILGLFSSNLERIARLKLRRPIGKSFENNRPNRLENWRSGRTKKNIRLNLAVLRSLYSEKSGLESLLRTYYAIELADKVQTKFKNAERILAEIPEPLHETIGVKENWQRLEKLHGEIESLGRIMSGPIAHTLGLVVGFNSLDGD